MTFGEALIYITGVGAMVFALVALIQVIKEFRKTQNHTINVQIPEEADKAIQKIAESYITLDKARSEHPITEQDIQASVLEARAIVAAHINTRIAIVTSGIEKLSRSRTKNLKDGWVHDANKQTKAIQQLESELEALQAKLKPVVELSKA